MYCSINFKYCSPKTPPTHNHYGNAVFGRFRLNLINFDAKVSDFAIREILINEIISYILYKEIFILNKHYYCNCIFSYSIPWCSLDLMWYNFYLNKVLKYFF